jgi:hypothetical protein
MTEQTVGEREGLDDIMLIMNSREGEEKRERKKRKETKEKRNYRDMETVVERAYAVQYTAPVRMTSLCRLATPHHTTAMLRLTPWYHRRVAPHDVRIYSPRSVKGGDQRRGEGGGRGGSSYGDGSCPSE